MMLLENWETEETKLAEGNLFACAYNAAVNYGSGRAHKKMIDLIEAVNWYERVLGYAKLSYLKSKGIISEFKPCSEECQMRPGGLFHTKDCENDSNHPVTKARQKKAQDELPGKESGYWIATASLVGLTARG